MKKIIKNRLYDTETARFLGADGYHLGSFEGYTEELYLKRTGEYFLCGSGGPASKYSRCTGLNHWSGSSQIIPLDFESARKWAEEHLDAEEYQKYFAVDPEQEDETREQLLVRLPSSLIQQIKLEASKNGRTISDQIVAMINRP